MLSSKEEFAAAAKALNLDNMQISVSATKNADKIRGADADLRKIEEELKENERLKPVACDCNCGNVPTRPIDNTLR